MAFDISSTIHLTPTVMSILSAAVVPLLVGLVTKYKASSGLKAILFLALSAVSALVSQVVAASGTFTLEALLKSFAITFGLGIAAHYGLYKPSGVSEKLLPEKGVGTPVTPGP